MLREGPLRPIEKSQTSVREWMLKVWWNSVSGQKLIRPGTSGRKSRGGRLPLELDLGQASGLKRGVSSLSNVR